MELHLGDVRLLYDITIKVTPKELEELRSGLNDTPDIKPGDYLRFLMLCFEVAEEDEG